jgi:3'-5' exoribonuclease
MIRDFTQGETVTEFLAVATINLRHYDQGQMLRLELSDSSGKIEAVVWDDAASTYEQLADVDVVKVQGLVTSYRDKPQLKVMRIRAANTDEYELDRLLRVVECGIDKLVEDFDRLIATLQDEFMAELMRRIRNDADFFDGYTRAPAGKRFHHDYIGGLAEHSISMANLADKCCEHYPKLNRDLLVCGALLHDIGKVVELSSGLRMDYTDEGRLIGHMTLGDEILTSYIADIPDFPDKLETKLRHLIASHHGERQYGAAVEPQTREAWVLHHVDKIDSGLNVFDHYDEKRSDEWSDFVNLWNRFLYFG